MTDETQHGGQEFAARVRRIADDTGAPFLEVVEALRRHRMDEEAATAELSDIRAKAHPEATTR